MDAEIKNTPFLVKALLLLIVVAFAWTVSVALEQVRVKKWPEVSATIIEYAHGEEPSAGGQQWYANPKIRYAYEVNGSAFESTQINPSPLNYQSIDQYDADTSGFREGSVVKCWYNSRDPSVAYLVNRGVTMDVWILLAATGFYTLNMARVYFLNRFRVVKNAG